MNRRSGVRDGRCLVALTMGVLIAQVAVSVAFADPFSLESRPTPNVEVVASITPPDPEPSGIAISKDGRIFLGFPRHADNHTQFALAELKDGKLIPFPRKDYVYPSTKPYAEWLVSPHGMTMDDNDALWVLDDGKRAGIKEIPEGAAKVVGIDISTRTIIASIVIGREAMGNDSHLNDLRVDLTHGKKGTVYIVNSGFGPRYSLVVVDVASGKSREVLLNQPATSPEPGSWRFWKDNPRSSIWKSRRFQSAARAALPWARATKKFIGRRSAGENYSVFRRRC